jgi:hypothetical protein
MIHYHGTPLGGSNQEAAKSAKNRHLLYSFYNQQQIEWTINECSSFVVDNGAFSHWKSGKGVIDIEAYFDFASTLAQHPAFDWCLIPDKIDGTEEDNNRMISEWEKIGDIPSVPIWHLHETLEKLQRLADNYDLVAIGSSGEYATIGTDAWRTRMDEAFTSICNENGIPSVRLHGLRMLDPRVFTYYPFKSCDSCNAAVNSGSLSRFGMYQPPTVSGRFNVIADRIESNNSPSTYTPHPQTIELCLQ